jgi:hypothetical protein
MLGEGREGVRERERERDKGRRKRRKGEKWRQGRKR